MKLHLPVFAFFITSLIVAQSPCENGVADIYPCWDYDMQSHLSLADLNAGSGNDSWGWTDPQDGKEYAIMCLDNGTAFIDISDPTDPVYLGKLPTHTSNSTWRDAKVYDNHAFIVSEAQGHGMQVFDLTRLRNVTNAPETFTEDAHYEEFGSAHNIAINEDTGYAYAVGTGTFSGGPHFIDIQDPVSPTAAGGFSGDFYSHDAQIVTYNGPDEDYTGKEIFVGSNEDVLSIVDVTDKNNPIGISTVTYGNVAYTHQGWFTENQQYFIVGDEIDELAFGFNTRTLIFDFTDLDNPQLHFEYEGPTTATDHNGYVKDNKYYLANYTAGLRILDIEFIAEENIIEIGYFDTYPGSDNVGTEKLWSVYPYFDSGNIILSDTDSGFFVVKQSEPDLGTNTATKNGFAMYPNPTTDVVTLQSEEETIQTVELFNTLGQKVLAFPEINTTSKTLDLSGVSRGVYTLRINGSTNKKLIKK